MLEKINNPVDIKKLNEKELIKLASDIRNFLIENVSFTGGHLASNLGIVELTIALLKTFDFTKDKIIFDVGHQCYIYKILTDRKDKMKSLRKYGGISGFPKITESKYDFFNSGHASNSISAALGMARARDLDKKDYNIISIVGDGALTGGMTFEALNDVGFRKSKMLIILNDNGMAISNSVGGVSNCLNGIRINPFYNRLKKKAHYRLDKIYSKKITNVIRGVKNKIKGLFLPSVYFENLGIKYIGPIDGHDTTKLVKTFSKIKQMEGPIVLHVKTIKGLGYEFAEKNPTIYHGVGSFSISEGLNVTSKKNTYSSVFGDKILKLASKYKKIVAITAAMPSGTGLEKFSKKYPNRFFDVGIAEEHAVTLAAGLALSNYKPYFAVYSTFLQRGFDQIIEDVCMQDLPVVFMIDRSGLVGEDGETHHGIFDTSYLSLIPNLTVMQPKCTDDLIKMLDFSVEFNHPLAIKYPKGNNKYAFNPIKTIEYGKWEVLRKGENIAIISSGRLLELAMELADKFNLMVVNAQFIKPIDTKLIKKLIKDNYQLLVLEENIISGGLGASILLETKYSNIEIIGINDKYICHGTINELLNQEKINIKNVSKIIEKMLKTK